ncbi:ArsR/SmtB family transcription factor [Lacticaseibacillus parakribbianus]|uniref:ArsR/SmtB family transcription factor n=1 Tax=Lacticaseibacillus parakribbianus TaxID=2970927 RepID=UPI0021CB508E|nr:metalloregulator ArsR/SmtB family transcription factor [Lacticaseibacillus parakribbianus]
MPLTQQLEAEFRASSQLLNAIGDEQRQHLICAMLEGQCGARVIDIAKQTNLSRPAVSHHMQILKSAGLVTAQKEGTKIYYYLNPDTAELAKIGQLLGDVQAALVAYRQEIQEAEAER